MKWTRTHTGYAATGHERMGHTIQVLDNGRNARPRWTAVVDGDTVDTFHSIDAAKNAALREADERVAATMPDYVPSCGDCGDPIDYCQGHGVLG